MPCPTKMCSVSTGWTSIVEGHVEGPPGSTIVDVTGPTPVVLRQGYLKIEETNR